MSGSVQSRASRVLLCGALIVTAVSSRGDLVVEAQAPALRWDGRTELISGKYDYLPTPSTMTPADGPSQMSRHAVSADGRYVIFNANAPSLGHYDDAVYLRDRRTGETRLLLAGPTRDAVISADGRHIAFTVCEPYMRPDYAPICDVWAIDTLTWSWTPLSVDPHQGEFGNADSDEPVLSGNGRFVVFRTTATNLVSGVTPGVPQLVIRDRDADRNGIFDEPGSSRMELVSVRDGSATAAGNGASATPEVSDDGRYVAFRSAADNLVPGDTNGVWDVFRRDRLARDTRRLNLRPYPFGDDESPAAIDSPAISMTPDGRFVAFTSEDPLLAPASMDDYNNVRDVFVFDAEAPYLERLDVGWGPPTAEGRVPGNGPTEWPTLSMDGRYVSLQSRATNVETAPTPGLFQTYVVDRADGRVTRVSLRADGVQPDRECVRPAISLDGTVVTYLSDAFNLARNVPTEHERIYAAVHFEISPAEQFVPGSAGGSATYDIATQEHTAWWLDWDDWQPWIEFAGAPMGIGNGTVTLRATQANPASTPRSAAIRIFDRSFVFTQLEGLSITSVSPSSGPATGGTQVTITGTGFEPDMRVFFAGFEAATTQFVDSTAMVATTPAHAPATVDVAVTGGPPDYRFAWIDSGFRFTDSTPPQLWTGFSDVPNEAGWFNRDVTLLWSWWDAESDVTAAPGCENAVIGTDTPGTTYTCTVTSEGGSTSLSASVKRDATAPTATITSPQFTLYDLGQVVEPAFTCSDAVSGVAICQGSTDGAPVDTSTPGYRTFTVAMTDRADNVGYASVDYAVGSGVCAYPLPDMVSWWRMEGDTTNMRTAIATNATRVGLTSDVYVDAVVGQGYQFGGANGYLQANYSPRIFSDKKFAVAAWVKPSANTRGTIMRVRDLFGVARLETGTIGWTFRKWNDSTMSYRDTRVALPLGRWSHVAVVLEGTAVRTYLNGRLAHTEPNVGDVDTAYSNLVTIGGYDNGDYFKGVLDELQIFQHGLTGAQIEQLFLAGNAGACVPKRTTFEIVEPIPAVVGSQTYAFDARLVDEDGVPVAGRTVELISQVSAWPHPTFTVYRVTDADGRVHWDAPLNNAPQGLYDRFAYATFTGDVDYVRTLASPDVLVGRGTPVINWPAPSAITYSFPVNSTQLNATADVPGTFSYSPVSGTLLPAGTNTLTATFTPADTARYHTVTATNTLVVNKATPNVVIEGAGDWAYTGQPRAVVGKVKDRFNTTIATPSLAYNGSPDAPVLPGEYTVVATFPGNANYEAGSATATLTITKSVVDIQLNVQDVTYDGRPHPAGVTVSGLHPDVFTADSVTYNGSPENPVNAGTYTVVATFNGTAVYEAATATRTFVIHKATPTVTVNGGTFTYDGTPRAASGTVTGGGGAALGSPVFTYNGAADAPVNGGVYSVVGTFAGDANHNPASGSGTITIGKAVPTLTVAGGAYVYDGQPHPATGSVTGVGGAALAGLTFTYNGSAEAPVNAGGYVVTGTYPGDANYEAVTRNTAIQIGPATPVVTVTGGTFTYDGQPHGASATVTGLGGVDLGPATLTYDGSTSVPVNAGSHVAVATFDGGGNYAYATGSAIVTIRKAVATVTAIGGTFTYDGQPHGATGFVTGIGDAPLGTPTFTYDGGAQPPVTVGTYQVLASFAGDVNYEPASATTAIAILQAPVVLEWEVPQSIVYGTPLGQAQLNATANVPGTFVYSPAAGTVLNAGAAQVLTARFTPSDPNYSADGLVNTTIDVARARATVTAAGGTFTYDGQPHPATGAVTGVDGVAMGTPMFTYNGSAETPVNAGSYAVVATFAGNANYEPASATATIAIGKASVNLTWSQPAGIVYGTPLGAGQLNASSNVPGTFSYGPAAGTVLPAGPAHVLTATFTPADSSNYTGGSVGTSIAVAAAPLAIRPNDSAKPFGAPVPAFTASAAGFVNGDTFASLSGALAFATNATAGSPVGSYPVTASGLSSPNYVITYLPGTLTVVRGAVRVTLSASPAPSGLNQPMTFTATIAAAAPAAGVPGGSVRFFDGATLLGAGTLSSGSAYLRTAGLAAGVHTIEARYDGDESFETGSASASHTVNSAAATPSITIASNRNPSSAGQSVTLTATLGMSAGPVSGTVEFYDGAMLLGTSAIVSGSATYTTTAFAAGSHAITVRYRGSATAPPATSGVFVQAVGSSGWKNRASSATLSASPTPSSPGAAVTLTANITGTSGTPSGTVLFMVNGEVVGAPVALAAVSGSTAQATLVLPGLAGGRHVVTATYLGNSTYRGSTASITQTVQ